VDRIAVVGASLGGLRAAESLRVEGFAGEIVLIGDEQHEPYDRPPLSKSYLTGDGHLTSVLLPHTFDGTMLLGSAAVGLDTRQKLLTLEDGTTQTYDGLVIATGTEPFVPPGIDTALGGVHLLRTAAEASALRADLHDEPHHVVVLGAGFIGGEIASTCHDLGIPVTLVDMAPLPLARPLGHEVATILLERHQVAGTRFRLGVSAQRLTHDDSLQVSGVDLTDGTHLPADLVIVAVGVRPSTSWLDGSGVAVDNGVLCDADLSSVSTPGVVAVGDVARWTHPLFGDSVRVEHWMNAVESASAAARTLMGRGEPYAAIPSFWSDQLGHKIQGIGIPSCADEVEVDLTDGVLATYRRAGRVVGAVVFEKPRRLLAVRRDLAAQAEALT